jgi:ATP-binding cassette subfamily B protein
MISALRSIRLILSLVFRADRRRTVLAFLLAALEGLSGVLIALWLKTIVDSVISSDFSDAVRGVALLQATLIIGMVSNWTSAITSQRLRERVDWLLDRELIEVTSGIPSLEHHERTDYLQEMELLRGEKGELSGMVSTLVSNFSILIQAIAVVLLLARLHPVLLTLPLFAVPSLWAGGRVERIRQKAQEESVEKSRVADHLFELATTAGPAKELRIFRLQEEVPQRHVGLWRELDRLRHRAALQGAALGGLGWLIFSIGFIGAIVLVVVRAVEGDRTPGDVILAVQLTGRVNQQVASAVSGVSELIRSLKTVRRFQWLLDYADEIRTQLTVTPRSPIPQRLLSGIDLTNISFTYPGTSTEALKNLTLTLRAGSTVAIVGENGAGKTTLVKLLCRFYEPTSGSITVDGTDLRRFDVEEWRERTASAFQDFVEFEFLARQTVGVGDLPAIDDVPAVERALVRASAGDVTTSLPLGLETQLGKTFAEGVELSAGQWQKLALGRGMMRNDPLLLILDEPTASLDAETEHALFERYSAAARSSAENTGAITVLVSHRFSTVRMADLIVVIDAGEMVESGPHEDLIRNSGLYAELYGLQARRYQ